MKDADGARQLDIKLQRAENDHVLVCVSDTGLGLPLQQADQLFNAFFTTKPHAQAWGCPSADPSLSRMTAACGPPTTLPAGQVFLSPYPPRRRPRNEPARHFHVFVVDDDPSMRASIQGLLKSANLRSESFGTAEEFLRSKRSDGPSCLVLDVSLPGINGLDFQRQLADAGIRIPIIFVTGHGDIPMNSEGHEIGCCGVSDQAVRRPGLAECDPPGFGSRPRDAPSAE